MSLAGKAFLYLIYFATIGVLVGLIVTSSKSNPPRPIPVTVHSQPKQPPAVSSTKTPPPLVNTGPGNIISLFVIVSITSTIVYRQIIIRQTNAD
jgi:hypothetical protein